MANKYSVLLKCLVNSNSHLVFKFEGKIFLLLLSTPLDLTNCQIDVFYLFLGWDSSRGRLALGPYPDIPERSGRCNRNWNSQRTEQGRPESTGMTTLDLKGRT